MKIYKIKIWMKKQFIAMMLWIKEYAHPSKVIGGVCFILVFVAGIFWIITNNNNLEPIALCLSLLSSALFAAPSIAEYFVPNRKPIRHMDLHEILQFIRETNAKTDWNLIHSNNAHEAFLIEDMRLRIRLRWDDGDSQARSFNEPWATRYPNPNASKDRYYLLYDGNLIEKFILVSVDSCRAILPLPIFSTLVVEPLDYKIAQIFDQQNSLDEYMGRSGLSVKNIEHSEPKI